MAWLPGQTCVGSSVEVAYEQISPSRFTVAPHILVPANKPPTVPPSGGATNAAASFRSPFNSEAEGRFLQFAGAAHAGTVAPKRATAAISRNLKFLCIYLSFEPDR